MRYKRTHRNHTIKDDNNGYFWTLVFIRRVTQLRPSNNLAVEWWGLSCEFLVVTQENLKNIWWFVVEIVTCGISEGKKTVPNMEYSNIMTVLTIFVETSLVFQVVQQKIHIKCNLQACIRGELNPDILNFMSFYSVESLYSSYHSSFSLEISPNTGYASSIFS